MLTRRCSHLLTLRLDHHVTLPSARKNGHLGVGRNETAEADKVPKRKALRVPDETLGGRVALVTGGTRGLGKEFARALAGAGARVAVISRDQGDCDEAAAEISAAGTLAIGVEADVTNRTQLDRCRHQIEETLGPVDVLVNNAGIALKKDALDVSFEEWSHVLSVNLDGVWNCSQIFGRGMVAAWAGVDHQHRLDVWTDRQSTQQSTRLQRVEGGGPPPD